MKLLSLAACMFMCLGSSGCVIQSTVPNFSTSKAFGEPLSAGSLHEKYSQSYADAHITRGVDNAMTIGIKFGEATFADRTENGDRVWAYQARTSMVSTDAKMGMNSNLGLFSASTAGASKINTETMSKITTLRVIFDNAGVVKDYHSETESR